MVAANSAAYQPALTIINACKPSSWRSAETAPKQLLGAPLVDKPLPSSNESYERIAFRQTGVWTKVDPSLVTLHCC